MSFTLPTIYANATKQGNIQENWIVQLYYDDLSAFTPIALSDTTVGGVFYPGVISSSPTIRTSIDLSNSTAKTNNVTLSVINFKYKGDDFSAELFLGSRKYINRTVKIYSQLNGNSTLANCFQIYNGRLIDISHDDSSIKLTLTEKRPWDFITIPNVKTSTTKSYFPVCYGDFTDNSNGSSINSPSEQDNDFLWKMPVDMINQDEIISLQRDGQSSNGKTYYYDSNAKVFSRIYEDSADGVLIDYQGGKAIAVNSSLKRWVRLRGNSIGATANSVTNSGSAFSSQTVTNFNNTENAIDGSTSTYSQVTIRTDFNSDMDNTADLLLSINLPTTDHSTSLIQTTLKYDLSSTGSGTIHASTRSQAIDKLYGSAHIYISEAPVNAYDGSAVTSTLTSSSYTTSNNSPSGTGIYIRQLLSVTVSNTGYFESGLRIYDWFIDEQKEVLDADKQDTKVDFLYSSSDGLTESWSGSNGAISYGHEAHRDMLIRFLGDATTTPENWSSLNTDKSIAAWKIRWWVLEPVELKKVLESIQYEFGFIFKFRADGTSSYIHIKQTSELSAVQTLNKHDISNLKINNTPFSELLTKMNINYSKHPSENKYRETVISSNSTSRTNWNIQAKENISEVNLDMNVGTPNSSGQTDPNSDFYSYYDNIFGDIKKIITCDIINPAKGYNLETGDIIQFSNSAGEMPVEPFGDNWADYYMITDLQRGLGTIKIQAREVG